jgi:hypothetical protein
MHVDVRSDACRIRDRNSAGGSDRIFKIFAVIAEVSHKRALGLEDTGNPVCKLRATAPPAPTAGGSGQLVCLKVWFRFEFDLRLQPLGHAFLVQGDELAGFTRNRDAVVGIDEIHRVAALHA